MDLNSINTDAEAFALLDTPEGSWGIVEQDGALVPWLRAHGGIYIPDESFWCLVEGHFINVSTSERMADVLESPVRIVTAPGTMQVLEAPQDAEAQQAWRDELDAVLTALPEGAAVLAGKLDNPENSNVFTLMLRRGKDMLISSCGHEDSGARDWFGGEDLSDEDEALGEEEFIRTHAAALGVPGTIAVLHRGPDQPQAAGFDIDDMTPAEALALLDCPEGSWGLLARGVHRLAWLRADEGLYMSSNDAYGEDTLTMVSDMPTPVRIVNEWGTVMVVGEVSEDDGLADEMLVAMLEHLPHDAVVFAGQLDNPGTSDAFSLASRVNGTWLSSDCGPGLTPDSRDWPFYYDEQVEQRADDLHDEGEDDSALIHECSVSLGVPDTITVLHRA